MVLAWPFVIGIGLYSMLFAWLALRRPSGVSRVISLVWLVASAVVVIVGIAGLQSAGGFFMFRFASGLVVLAMAALGVFFAFAMAVIGARSRDD